MAFTQTSFQAANLQNTAPQPSKPRKRTRPLTRVACNKCRERKAACDGDRPICGRCRTFGQHCSFDAEAGETRADAVRREADVLRQENDETRERNVTLERQLAQLRAGSQVSDSGYSDSSAQSSKTVFQPKSNFEDAGELQKDIFATNLNRNVNLLHPAARQLARFDSSDSGSALEFELMIRHPVAYPNLQDAELDACAKYELQQTRHLFADIEFRSSEAPHSGCPKDFVNMRSIEATIDVPTPYQHEELCDPRLRQLKIDFWSRVPISDQVAARLISQYLTKDHPLLGMFDPDLFLDDLVTHNTEFCSSMLVNAVLLYSSHSYTFGDQTSFYKQFFLSETERLWREQEDTPSLHTIAAGLCLNMAHVCSGDDGRAAEIILKIEQLGHSLGLFGTPEEITTRLTVHDVNLLRARCWAAWGSFNYLVHRTVNFRDVWMTKTPRYVIPGDNAVLGYTEDGSPVFHRLPHYMGNTFAKLSKLHLIVNEVALAYFANSETGKTVTIDFAELTYQKLLHWADTLEETLVPKATTHHGEVFYALFHSTVLDLFRPFLARNNRLRTFSSEHKTPRDVFMASVNQLKRHILTFSTKHGSFATSVWPHIALLQVANAVLTDMGNTKSRLLFLFCIRRYHELSLSFPVFSSLVRGLLGAAVRIGALSGHQVRQISAGLGAMKGSALATKYVETTLAIDLDRALTDFQTSQVEYLVKEID